MTGKRKRESHDARQDANEVVDLTLSESEDEIQFVKEQAGSSCDLRGPGKPAAATTSTKSINDVLKSTRAGPTQAARSLPPLLLTRPEQVAKHTPCSLHFNILPAELAERLYLRMLQESKQWERNRWYLNDRQVESPHTTAFYTSDEKADVSHWYMGRKDQDEAPRLFLREQEEARQIIEGFVNKQLEGKQRESMEFEGPWRANVCAANCYRGAAEASLFPNAMQSCADRTALLDRRSACRSAHLPWAIPDNRLFVTWCHTQFPLARRTIASVA